MLGRFVRLLVGLVILGVCLDIFAPSAVRFLPPLPPLRLGAFEDMRDAIAAIVGMTGFAFVFAAAFPPAGSRPKARAVAGMGPDLTAPGDIAATAAHDEEPPATVAERASTVPEPAAPTPAAEAEVWTSNVVAIAHVAPDVLEAEDETPAHEPAEASAAVEVNAAPTAPILTLVQHSQPELAAANDEPASSETRKSARPVLTLVPYEEPVATAWDMAPSAGPAFDATIDEPPAAALEDYGSAPVAEVVAAADRDVIAIEAAPAVAALAEAAPASDESSPEPGELGASTPVGRPAFVSATEAGDKLRLEGDWDGAMEHYDEALELARANLGATPDDPQARADLAGALTNVGDIYDEQGRLDLALQAHEESLDLRRAMAAAAPDDKRALRALSLGLERLADTRESRGHRTRALDLYRESLPIARRLAGEHPNEAIYANDLEITQARVNALEAELAPPLMSMVYD
jgi:tetratricopeptide (TPR) repeat protein